MNAGQHILTGADIYIYIYIYIYICICIYFMCFMQNVYGNIFYMHFMHIGLIPAS